MHYGFIRVDVANDAPAIQQALDDLRDIGPVDDAMFIKTLGDGCLDGGGIVNHAVALGAIIAHVEYVAVSGKDDVLAIGDGGQQGKGSESEHVRASGVVATRLVAR
jgi:hypothetical protein